MNIFIAKTDTDINACFPVMQELRPHLQKAQFVSRVRYRQNTGYILACIQDQDTVVAVAGFRISENLAWGRFLYVDDLVTAAQHRSRGYGAKLLTWLREYAASENCQQFHLDSGVQRKDAHRFYEREGMAITGYHFAEDLTANS